MVRWLTLRRRGDGACAVARRDLAVGDGGGTLAQPPQGTNLRLYGDANPMADASFAVKIDLLRRIKQSFDPAGILNPGVLL